GDDADGRGRPSPRPPARSSRPAPIPEAVAARGPADLPGFGGIRKDRNGQTPFGRIRSCMCATPHICRDIAWRWARLRRGRYINFLLVPSRSAKCTPTAEHVNAYRSVVFRSLGFGEDGSDVERTIMNRSRTRGEGGRRTPARGAPQRPALPPRRDAVRRRQHRGTVVGQDGEVEGSAGGGGEAGVRRRAPVPGRRRGGEGDVLRRPELPGGEGARGRRGGRGEVVRGPDAAGPGGGTRRCC
ncbi:hypothetical protein THAOC_11623, partial [Thalassiosira oceanica]